MGPEEEEEEPPPPPPPDPDEDTELTTGLKLPLRPKDIAHIWSLQNDHVARAQLILEMMGLESAYPGLDPAQRNIVCDFHLFNITHAKAICLDHRQGAVFVAI